MNPAAAVVLSSFFLGVGGVTAYLTLAAPPAHQVEATSDSVARTGGDQDLAAAVRALQERFRDLEQQVAVAASGPRTPAQVDADALERAVAAYLEGREVPGPAPATELDAAALETPEQFFAALMELGALDSPELWKAIVEQGLEDEVLALYQAAADAAPNDPEAQLALGQALIGLTQQHAGSATAGRYATLADAAFDAALEADPQHWDARYNKAVSLSFWPPIFGKQGAAIQQFETLVQQQSGMVPTPEHASTHLMLGNMYQQTGQMDKAVAAWQLGLQLFPDHADLAAQLALATGGGGN